MTLTRTETHISPEGFSISDMSVVVEYNPDTMEVEKVYAINVYNYHNGKTTDMAWHLSDHYPEALDSIVNATDWAELAANEERIQLEENSAPVTSY